MIALLASLGLLPLDPSDLSDALAGIDADTLVALTTAWAAEITRRRMLRRARDRRAAKVLPLYGKWWR